MRKRDEMGTSGTSTTFVSNEARNQHAAITIFFDGSGGINIYTSNPPRLRGAVSLIEADWDRIAGAIAAMKKVKRKASRGSKR